MQTLQQGMCSGRASCRLDAVRPHYGFGQLARRPMHIVRHQRQRLLAPIRRPVATLCVMGTSKVSAGQMRPHLPAPVLQLAALAVSVVRGAAAWARQRLSQTAEQAKQTDLQTVIDGIRHTRKQYRVYAMVAPFAAVSSTADTFLLVSKAVGSFVKLYLLLLFIRVLLSWFPTFNWENQPWLALRQVTDPYLNLFRGLVPPLMGTIDFTPLFGFLILQFLAAALNLEDDSDEW